MVWVKEVNIVARLGLLVFAPCSQIEPLPTIPAYEAVRNISTPE